MSTIENERYMRYILLLGVGGTLVLKENLKMETSKASKPLEELLKANETKMDKYTNKKLFGSSGNQDVDTWDISLLATVILHLFDNSITQDIKECIKSLKEMRNTIAHAASMSLNADEYDKKRKAIAAIIIKLSTGLSQMVHDECQDLIKKFAAGPIDIVSATKTVEELRKCDKDVCTILESLLREMAVVMNKVNGISTELEGLSGNMAAMSTEMNGILSEVRACSTKMEDVATRVECNSARWENSSREVEVHSAQLEVIGNEMAEIKLLLQKNIAQDKCDMESSRELRTKMTLKGPNDHLTKATEESVTWYLNSISTKAKEGDESLQKVHTILRSIWSDIENCTGAKVTEVEYKCILIKMRCNNCKGLLQLLEYLESSLFKQRLHELSKALEETYKERFDVSFIIDPDDLKNILCDLKDYDKENGNIGHDEINADRYTDASTKVIEFETPQEKPSDMVDIEAKLRKYRHEFEKCLKDPSIVSHLLAKSVITDVDAARIKNLYIDRETVKASHDLLDAVFTSKAPGKWRSFVDSLESAEYPYLKELLSYQNIYDAFTSSRAQKILSLFTPYLEQIICAHEFVSELRSRGVINAADKELILKTYETKGGIYSAMILLDRMQCRKSPQDWYYEFLDLLMKKKFEHIVKEMEPDFIDNPSAFMPKQGTIISNKKEDIMVSRRNEFEEEQGACGSLHEHFIEDKGEGYENTNDLGAPPSLTMRQDSSLSSTEYQIESLETNSKELNIKPDMTKPLSVGILQREDSKPGNTGIQTAGLGNNEDDEDDEDSMGSDYDNTEVEAAALASHTAAPFQLREYQLELAENAVLGRNTIICAETGSGKTWVALHIVQQHLQNARNGQRKVVFMARTGALIKQQSDRFKTYLPQFQTRLITGEDDQSRMLNMFLETYDILCFTPQILVNNLEDNVIKSLSEFSLLILDECHHTRGDDPYSTLMRKYLVEKSKTKKDMPQVVGLTASIGVGKSRTDQESVDYILRVCSCLDVRIISTVERNFKELKKHVSIPDEETIQLVKQKDDPCKQFILTAMEETEDMLQDNSLMQPDMIDLMDKQPRDRESQEYNKWTVDVMRAALLKVDDYDVSRDISSCAKYLNIYNSALEVNKLLLSRDVIKYLAEKHRLEGENKDKLTEMEKELFKNLQNVQKTINVKGKNTENPNVRILSDTLRKMLDDKGDDSRAMVFVKARATCRSLAAFLDRDLQSSGVKASPLYGKENRGGDDGMTESQQTEILDKFRSGFFKVLVCTSVGNEGIDVPDCNIVLSYEYSGDEITKIQMKGRARKKKATTITMGSDKVVEQEMINTYKAAMMYRAMNIVKQLDPKYINMKVNAFQSEETHKYRFKAEVEKLKKGRKSDEDYEILCGRCNTFACYVSDVRQLGHDHIVIDKDFADKITKKEHKKPKTYDGLQKKYKMYCKKCPIDWGIIGLRDGLDCRILKIVNFKFRNLRTHGVSTYKKWIDVPYAVPEIKLEDLPRLLGPEET